MGYLRLGGAVLTSLLITAFFTIVGGGLGAAIFTQVAGQGTTTSTLSSPVGYLGGGVGGGVGLLLGLFGMRATIKQAAKVNWLYRHGTRILAQVVAVENKRGFQFQFGPHLPGEIQRSPSQYYVMVAEWMDPSTSQRYTFRSEHLPIPRNFAIGDSIAVRMDPQNPSRYLVEV